MDPIFSLPPQLLPYFPTLLALALLCLMVLAQGFLAGILGLGSGEETAGMPLRGDHSRFSFRVLRTYGNSTENFPVIVTTAALAVIAGVSPLLVNWLVWLYVAFRLAFWAIYYGGIGQVNAGPRTIVYALAQFLNIGLALAVFYTLVV